MNIVVIGAGGVGGYFGAKLAKGGADVTIVARGAHLHNICKNGLTVRSAVDGEWNVRVRATATLASNVPADLVLVCVKSFDTEGAAEIARPVIRAHTAVLSLQNGVDNEEKLASILGPDHIMGGIAYVFANIEHPGVIAHHQLGRIVFGELNHGNTQRAALILKMFEKATIPAELSMNIRTALWDKYVFQTALGGTTAATRLPVRYVQSNKEIRALWQNQIDELLVLAKAARVNFGSDKAEKYSTFLDSLSPSNYSSIYQDLIRGNRLELETFHGYALHLGAIHAIPTPTIAAIYAALVGYKDGIPIV